MRPKRKRTTGRKRSRPSLATLSPPKDLSSVKTVRSPGELSRPSKILKVEGQTAYVGLSDDAEMREELRRLRQLQQLGDHLAGLESVEALRREVVDLGLKLSGTTRGLWAELEDGGRACEMKALSGWTRSEVEGPELELAQRMVALVVADQKPYFITDLRDVDRGAARKPRLAAICALPLLSGKQLRGALLFAQTEARDEFPRSHREVLASFARQAAIQDARLAVDGDSRKRLKAMRESQRAVRERLAQAQEKIRELSGEVPVGDGTLAAAQHHFTRSYLKGLVRRCDGSLTSAATEAGISRSELVTMLEAYELSIRKKRRSKNGEPSRRRSSK